jgi:hypothetical protein
MSKITFGREIDMNLLNNPKGDAVTIAYHSGGGGFPKGSLLQKDSSGEVSYVGGSGAVGATGPSGGILYVSKTKLEIDALISNNSLIPGTLYKISGFYKNKSLAGGYPMAKVLYDDGTNSGITIYLIAVSSNKLSTSGQGEFYNPRYYDISTYTQDTIYGVYGIWDGDNPGGSIVSYQIGQVTFWGGYSWMNKTGALGSKLDILNLDLNNWDKIPYSNLDYYDKVIDEVSVDYPRDYLSVRKNVENNIEVYSSASVAVYNNGNQFHSISVMAWGLYSKVADVNISGSNMLDYDISGIHNLCVINSYCETVNFKGNYFMDSYMYGNSYFDSNYMGYGTRFRNNSMTTSNISDNIFKFDTNLADNTLNFSQIRDTILNYGGIEQNHLSNSFIRNNTIHGYINGNYLNASEIIGNTLTSFSAINNNSLDIISAINNIVLNSKSIISCKLFKSSFKLSGAILSFPIDSITSNYSDITVISASASIIFENFPKELYRRPDGVVKIKYFNNFDTLVIADITD